MDRTGVTQLVKQVSKMRVLGGPFAGMLMSERTSWGDGDVAPKLLGVYEEELHGFFERARSRKYDAVIDVGCAEGYYAVGAALRFSNSTVYAFDENEYAQSVCRETAELNAVSDRVRIGGHCSAGDLVALAQAHPISLAILDCEGYERHIFAPDVDMASFREMDFVIECHDQYDGEITPYLVARLFATHTVQVVYAAGRNPNRFHFLAALSDYDRWMAICENRGWLMHWLVCESNFSL